ncbi:MAG: pilus assembly protein PilP [Desulfobacterales bacterium]|jgi:type IV pilus assembly protein PilP
MNKGYTICTCLAGIICLAFFFAGCEGQSEPPKPQVVRKKITVKAPSAKRARTAKKSRVAQKARTTRAKSGLRPQSAISKTPKSLVVSAKSKGATSPAKTRGKPKAAKSKVSPARPKTVVFEPKSDVSETPKDMIAQKQPTAKIKTPPLPAATASKPKTTVEKKPLKTPQATAKAKRKAPEAKASAASAKTAVSPKPDSKPEPYNPAGKIDPFEPLFKEQPVVTQAKRVVKKRTPRTPLEKIDISQLKLVGIVLAPSGNKALVQEASGKGYIIKKGTYIGTNSGRVVDIQKDNVVIEEEVADVLGKVMTRKKEIRLPKPPGE